MAGISFFGAFFILYLAYESIRISKIEIKSNERDTHTLKESLLKGVVANFLSPHPYIFSISIGAPLVIKAYSVSITAALLFVLLFYVFLIGSKIVIAIIVDYTKGMFHSKIYIYTIKVLGLVLIAFSIFFIRDGLKYLKLL